MSTELKDVPFESLVDKGVERILNEVLGGKQPLRSVVWSITELAARWGHDTEAEKQRLLIKRLEEFHVEVESLGSLPDIKHKLAEYERLTKQKS